MKEELERIFGGVMYEIDVGVNPEIAQQLGITAGILYCDLFTQTVYCKVGDTYKFWSKQRIVEAKSWKELKTKEDLL